MGLHAATGGKTAVVLIKDFPYYRHLSNLKIFKIMSLTRASGSLSLRGFSILSPSTPPPFSEVNKDSFLRTNLVQVQVTGKTTSACDWEEDNVLVPLLLNEAEAGI